MQIDPVRAAVDRVNECIATASQHYGQSFEKIPVHFDLTGQTAGMFCRRRNPDTGIEKLYFRLNKDLLIENLDHFLADTIPHEVSHYVTRVRWGWKVKSHGPEWTSVMTQCFSIAPNRLHSLDTTTSSPSPFIYGCTCPGKEFSLSVRMHNKILRGSVRVCKACRGKLVLLRFVESSPPPQREIAALFVSTGGARLTATHLKKIAAIVHSHQVKKLVADHLMAADKRLGDLRKIVKPPADCFAIHANALTLPGGLSHAILFADQEGDIERQVRAAKALSTRGVAVRLLRLEPA